MVKQLKNENVITCNLTNIDLPQEYSPRLRLSSCYFILMPVRSAFGTDYVSSVVDNIALAFDCMERVPI